MRGSRGDGGGRPGRALLSGSRWSGAPLPPASPGGKLPVSSSAETWRRSLSFCEPLSPPGPEGIGGGGFWGLLGLGSFDRQEVGRPVGLATARGCGFGSHSVLSSKERDPHSVFALSPEDSMSLEGRGKSCCHWGGQRRHPKPQTLRPHCLPDIFPRPPWIPLGIKPTGSQAPPTLAASLSLITLRSFLPRGLGLTVFLPGNLLPQLFHDQCLLVIQVASPSQRGPS